MLSALSHPPPLREARSVSIPFREFKCCRITRWFSIPATLQRFQSLSGNSSVVGYTFPQFEAGSPEEFQSLSGNSSVVGQALRPARKTASASFNPFQGIQVLSASDEIVLIGLCQDMFQSLSGNSSVVGNIRAEGQLEPRGSFNPFQGIQVLSVPMLSHAFLFSVWFQSLSGNSSVVGRIFPFHQKMILSFQSLSGNSSVVGHFSGQVFEGYNRFQSLSGNSSVVGFGNLPPGFSSVPFQSLSGNSSVVGRVFASMLIFGFSSVSIPFREFKCCRLYGAWSRKPFFSPSFNPFQGIQVLSVEFFLTPFRSSVVSIPFREFKCCREAVRNQMKAVGMFQSLSGNSSVVGV